MINVYKRCQRSRSSPLLLLQWTGAWLVSTEWRQTDSPSERWLAGLPRHVTTRPRPPDVTTLVISASTCKVSYSVANYFSGPNAVEWNSVLVHARSAMSRWTDRQWVILRGDFPGYLLIFLCIYSCLFEFSCLYTSLRLADCCTKTPIIERQEDSNSLHLCCLTSPINSSQVVFNVYLFVRSDALSFCYVFVLFFLSFACMDFRDLIQIKRKRKWTNEWITLFLV